MLEKIALQKGLISKEDFNKAVTACKGAKDYESALKEFFISENIITAQKVNQLQKSLAAMKRLRFDAKFGEAALKLGFLDKNTLTTALAAQKKTMAGNLQPKPIGQILFDAGKLTREQVMQTLKLQKQAPAKAAPPTGPSPAGQAPDTAETKVAPPKPEKRTLEIDGGMILEVSADAMTASLKKNDRFDNSLSVDDLYTILRSSGIVFGLMEDKMMEGFINSSGFKTNAFKAASGVTRIQGMDARIEYYFDTDYLKAGGMDEEGNIDFKDRGKIPKVEEGTLLAKKSPIILSRVGKDVYGNELETLPVYDVDLRTRTGAELSEDGTRLYASVSGYPRLAWSGHINVLSDFLVKGDVNYETGHVAYDGDILVKGCLKSGFHITGNNIRVQEVDGGTITATGNVTIDDGANNAVIHSLGHVSAKFIHDTAITCLGNLKIDKEIVDSIIEISGACDIEHGEIINSLVRAGQGVKAKNLGTGKTAPNTIQVGTGHYIENRCREIDKKADALKAELATLKKKRERPIFEIRKTDMSVEKISGEMEKCREESRMIKAEIAALEDPSEKNKTFKSLKRSLMQNQSRFDRLDRELSERFDIIAESTMLIEEIGQDLIKCKDALEDLLIKKSNFAEWDSANTGIAEVIVKGMAFADTLIKGPASQLELKENITRVKVSEVLVQDDDDPSYTIYEMRIHDHIKR